MKKIAIFAFKLLFGISVIMTVFILFHPKSISFEVSPKLVVERIKNALNDAGTTKTLLLYIIQAPVYEEIIYRGPIWIVCIILGFLGIKNGWGKSLTIWSVLLIPTLAWAHDHPYPPFYQSLVFLGGVFNGICIINILEKRWKRVWIVGSLLLVIFLHSLSNALIVYLVYSFF